MPAWMFAGKFDRLRVTNLVGAELPQEREGVSRDGASDGLQVVDRVRDECLVRGGHRGTEGTDAADQPGLRDGLRARLKLARQHRPSAAVGQNLLCVGGLGADVRRRTRAQQALKLRMERLRLGVEEVKLLAEIAKQRRNRDRYLVLRRSYYAGGRAGSGGSGLGQRGANTRQVLGCTLDHLRLGDHI